MQIQGTPAAPAVDQGCEGRRLTHRAQLNLQTVPAMSGLARLIPWVHPGLRKQRKASMEAEAPSGWRSGPHRADFTAGGPALAASGAAQVLALLTAADR